MLALTTNQSTLLYFFLFTQRLSWDTANVGVINQLIDLIVLFYRILYSVFIDLPEYADDSRPFLKMYDQSTIMMFVKIALLVLQILHLLWTILIVKSAATKFTKGEVRYLMLFINKIAGFFSYRWKNYVLRCCFMPSVKITWQISYQKQDLLTIREHLCSTLFYFGGVRVVPLFSVLCCVVFFFVLVLSRVCQILHVSLNSPFLIVPSVLSGVYFNCIITRMCYMWWNDDDICFVLNQCIYMVARLNNNSQLNISLNSDTVATILSICSCSFIKRDPGI
jgi:hypothetical protein